MCTVTMPMQIRKTEETGFCFGVKRALRTLEEATQKYGEVETVGPVVHNQQVVDQFARLGVKVVADPDEVKGRRGGHLVAWPATASIRDKLKSRRLTISIPHAPTFTEPS